MPSPPPRLTWFGVSVFSSVYVVFAMTYAGCVAWEVHRAFGPLLVRSLVDYGVKALYTLPVWYIVVRRMDGARWGAKLAAHALLCPAFLLLWRSTYYQAVEWAGVVPVHTPARMWHLFISFLIYALQFSFLHLVRSYGELRERTSRETHYRQLALKSELTVLRAQIDPHFLFNSLHSISASIPPELESARKLIARLGSLLRYSLSSSERPAAQLRDDLEFVRNYLELETARFGRRVQVEYDIDEELLDVTVPPMVLQPLIENAVKHGIAASTDGGTIRLMVGRVGDMIHFTVENSVPTKPGELATAGLGLGLRNCDARLRAMYGNVARLAIEHSNGLFKASFQLPMASKPLPQLVDR